MSITFANLPQFEVLETRREGSITKFSGIIKNATLSQARPKWVVTICVNQNEFIQGRFLEIDPQTFRTVIEVAGSEISDDIGIGDIYPLLDGYWGNLAKLVFDTSIVWKKVKFKPRDGIFHRSDGTTETIKDGWDHEHCKICMQRISQHESDSNPYGYVNQKNDWLCESCFQTYVQQKSLDFIILNQMF